MIRIQKTLVVVVVVNDDVVQRLAGSLEASHCRQTTHHTALLLASHWRHANLTQHKKRSRDGCMVCVEKEREREKAWGWQWQYGMQMQVAAAGRGGEANIPCHACIGCRRDGKSLQCIQASHAPTPLLLLLLPPLPPIGIDRIVVNVDVHIDRSSLARGIS